MLPPSIWLNVFKRLNYPDTLSCAKVCQLWHKIIEDHVQHPQTFLELVADEHKYDSNFDLKNYIRFHKNTEFQSQFEITDHLKNIVFISDIKSEYCDHDEYKHEFFIYYDLFIVYFHHPDDEWSSDDDDDDHDDNDNTDGIKRPSYEKYEDWLNEKISIYNTANDDTDDILLEVNDFEFILKYFKYAGKDKMIKYMCSRMQY